MSSREDPIMLKFIGLTLLLVVVLSVGPVAAGFAETTCFQCHKRAEFQGKTVHQPVAKGRCSACHSPHVARFKGLLQRSGATLCYGCHKDQATAFGKGIVHQPVSQGQCLTCHDAHASEAKGLLKGRLAGSCFACHKKLEAKYKHTHSPYAKGNCLACHQPHQAARVQLLKSEPDRLCVSCHKRDMVEQAHPNFPNEVRGCLSCHNPHGSSRKAMVRNVLHKPFKKACTECHGKGGTGTETCLRCHEEIEKEVLAIHGHLLYQEGNSCTACHSPHAGDTASLLKGSQKQICRNCHVDSFNRYRDRLYIHPEPFDCKECHAVHGSNHLAMLKDGGNNTCSRCHETQGKFTHPVGEEVVDQRSGQMVTCVSCHHPMGTDFKYNLKLSGEKDLCIQCHQAY